MREFASQLPERMRSLPVDGRGYPVLGTLAEGMPGAEIGFAPAKETRQ